MENNSISSDTCEDVENAERNETSALDRKGILSDYKILNDAKQAKREKRKSFFQFIKYALCAASAGIIQFISFTILQAVIPSSGKTLHFIVEDMDVVTFTATTVALCLSVLWNFTLNRKFTFKDAGNVPKAMILAFLFYVPFYPFQTWYVHTVKFSLAEHISLDGAGVIAEATVMIFNFVLEFFWQKFVVFRKKKGDKNTQGNGEAEQNPGQDPDQGSNRDK